MRNRYSSAPDPEWQRTVALRRVNEMREGAGRAGRPVPTDAHLAHIAAGYVGVSDAQVLRWMKGEK